MGFGFEVWGFGFRVWGFKVLGLCISPESLVL